jgi:hypothetical protein
MSWSFSVTENSKFDALRVFDNTLSDNSAYIPDAFRGQLSDAAKTLADALPASNRKVTLSTAGHVESNGITGNASVSMYYTAADEDIPNVPMPKRTIETAEADADAHRDAGDQRAAEAQDAAGEPASEGTGSEIGDGSEGIEPRV